MGIELDYKPGQEAVYHESGEVLRVRVLESRGNEGIEAYRLQVLRVIGESGLVTPPKVGDIFNCDKDRSVAVSGLWRLTNK